jgi:hypothetical protein
MAVAQKPKFVTFIFGAIAKEYNFDLCPNLYENYNRLDWVGGHLK